MSSTYNYRIQTTISSTTGMENNSFERCHPTVRKVNSSLPLAISLYFNQYLSLVYAIVIGWCSLNKALYLRYNDKFVFFLQPICYVIWLIVEFLRIPHGIKGNKLEDISRLSESFYLTICPQCLILTYLSFLEPYVFSVERLLGILQLCMLISQLIFGFQTIMKMIHYKSQSNLWDDMKIH